MSQHAQSDAQLADQIRAVYQANRKVYGSARVHAELQAQTDHLRGIRVARLMREHGLAGRPRHRTTTRSDPNARVRQITSIVTSRPHVLTRNGLAISLPTGPMRAGSRLSVVLDLFSRLVIGWAMSANQSKTLVETARLLALLGRHPETRLSFHSDRGPQ